MPAQIDEKPHIYWGFFYIFNKIQHEVLKEKR